MPHKALCIILLQYVNSNWVYGSDTAKFGFDLCDLDPLPFCMDTTSVNGNNS